MIIIILALHCVWTLHQNLLLLELEDGSIVAGINAVDGYCIISVGGCLLQEVFNGDVAFLVVVGTRWVSHF